MSSIETAQSDETTQTDDGQAAPVALPVRPQSNARLARHVRGQEAASPNGPLCAEVVVAKLQELVAIQRVLDARKARQ